MSLSDFLACDISNDFGLSVDTLAHWIATTDKYTARFNVWCNDDENTCKEVLNAVAANGMSPALFVAKELAEGYSSYGGGLGWHNHTYPQGNYLEDAKYVSSYTVNLDCSGFTPSWIDAGNPVECVPADVQTAGNAEYASWGNQTIGKKYCAMTAAAAWGTWYPAALSASVNGVANYANPIQQCYDLIFGTLGGTINGNSVNDGITSGGESGNNKQETTTTVTIDMSEIREKVKQAIEDIFNRNIQSLSPMYASNGKITLNMIMNQLTKANINPDELQKIIDIIQDVTKEVTSSTDSNGAAGDNAGTNAGNGTVTSGNSEKVNTALTALKGQIGNMLGDGQCYSLSAWYSVQISGYSCQYSVSGTMLTAVGDTYNAHSLHLGWQWSQAGAQVIDFKGKSVSPSDCKAGDIFCIEAYQGAPVYTQQWGHTGVIESIDGDTITVLEQNYAGHQWCEERQYNATQFCATISGLVRWN